MEFQLAPKAIEREAQVILRRLGAPGAYLQADTCGDGDFGLMVRRNNFAAPVARYDRRVVRHLEDRGWLTATPLDRLELSAGGTSWLLQRGIRVSAAARKTPGGQRSSAADRAPGRNGRENPLDWLKDRKGPDGRPLIDAVMHEAGERLRADFERGQLSARVTAHWDAAIPARGSRRTGSRPDGLDVSDAALAARQRVWRALRAVGPGLSGVLVEVCCLARGLEAAERQLKWPKRSAKLVLVIALDRLADHYGLRGKSRPAARISAWGLADHRPDLLGHLHEPGDDCSSAV